MTPTQAAKIISWLLAIRLMNSQSWEMLLRQTKPQRTISQIQKSCLMLPHCLVNIQFDLLCWAEMVCTHPHLITEDYWGGASWLNEPQRARAKILRSSSWRKSVIRNSVCLFGVLIVQIQFVCSETFLPRRHIYPQVEMVQRRHCQRTTISPADQTAAGLRKKMVLRTGSASAGLHDLIFDHLYAALDTVPGGSVWPQRYLSVVERGIWKSELAVACLAIRGANL